jgi:tetratricopeptide (TPR) repeat protein
MMDMGRAERRRLLDEANKARARGRNRRAIQIYRHVHGQEPDDEEIMLRLAELLAAEGQRFEAWNLFRAAGKSHMRARRFDQCLALFREATRCLPFEFDVWRITAELERKLGREEEAQLTLLEGRRRFRSRFDRAQAIALLEMVRQVEPWDFAVVMDLARLYAQSDQRLQALVLLERMAVHSEGRQLSAVRLAQWQISHTFHHMRLWLKSLFAPSDALPDHESLSVGSTTFPLRVR